MSGDLDVSGISTFGKTEASSTDNVIPFYYDNLSQLPSSATYHGALLMFIQLEEHILHMLDGKN